MSSNLNPQQLEDMWRRLSLHEPPKGPSEEGWYFDQLLGSAVGLDALSALGIAEANAYDQYRQNVQNLRDSTSLEYRAFFSGFLLNCALHRTVWACERLLRFIGQEKGSFSDVLDKARPKANNRPALNMVLQHFPKGKKKNEAYEKEPATRNNVLRIIRGRVNRQKHWGTRANGKKTRGSNMAGLWNDLSGEMQHQLLCGAMSLVIDLFWEIFARPEPQEKAAT